ncbi:Hypothetical predicted protein [Octopus vulgaris]|uniref:Uncharacterized protein n=1 Tax=Octopus vulgaris TaxID=6645 RepID=A0AA36EW44_OCTVU|nr:Hypothetical predicted protein [Octopus vulgaris]
MKRGNPAVRDPVIDLLSFVADATMLDFAINAVTSAATGVQGHNGSNLEPFSNRKCDVCLCLEKNRYINEKKKKPTQQRSELLKVIFSDQCDLYIVRKIIVVGDMTIKQVTKNNIINENIMKR